MNIKPIRTLAAAALTSALLLPTTPAAAEEANHWRFDASLNLFMAGLSGDVTAHGFPASVDASFSDIWANLEAGAAGRVTVAYDRWVFSTEVSYMRLSASVPVANVEMEQWLVEPSLGYEFCKYFEAFAGARYNNLAGDVTFNGPLGKVPTGTQDWWDPIVGVQLSLPLIGKALSFDGRFDVGGFGLGSDVTWQAFPYFNWRFARWGSVQAGYRWLGTDYETGSGLNKFRYDMIAQGPQVGMTISF